MIIPPRGAKPELTISGDTPLEKQAVQARLDALGVKSGGEVIGKSDLAGAQVTRADLAGVAPDGRLDLARLDGLRTSSRLFGLRTVDLQLGDPTAAKAALNEHRGKLELATKKLADLASPERWGELADHTELLGQLAKVMGSLVDTTANLQKVEVLAHLDKAGLDAISTAQRGLLDGYARAAEGLRREAVEVAGSKVALAHVASIMSAFGRLLGSASLFAPGGDEPKAAAARDGQSAAEVRLAQATEARGMLDEMNAAHPTADAATRDGLLLTVFDTGPFRALDADERALWMRGLGALAPEALALEVPSLRALLAVDGLAALDRPNRELAVNLLTRLEPGERGPRLEALAAAAKGGALAGDPKAIAAALGQALAGPVRPRGAASGLVSTDDLRRTDAAAELVRAHDAERPKPVHFQLKGAERLRQIQERLGGLGGEERAVSVELDRAKKAIATSEARALEALPDYAAFTAHREKVGALQERLKKSEKRRDQADWIIRDWRTGRHDWKLKFGSEVGFGYFADKETAERHAPRVIREETDRIAETRVELRQLQGEVDRWNAYEAASVRPVRTAHAEQKRAVEERSYAAQRAISDERGALRREANDLASNGFRDGGQRWVLDKGAFSFWSTNELYDQRFTKNGYQEMHARIAQFPRVMASQAADAARPLGLLEVDAKVKRQESYDYLLKNLTAFEDQTKGDALGRERDWDRQARTVWNTIATALNPIYAPPRG